MPLGRSKHPWLAEALAGAEHQIGRSFAKANQLDLGRFALSNSPHSQLGHQYCMKSRVFFWSLTSALAGFLVRLRHGRHFRRGTNHPVALGAGRRPAWRGDGGRALRHGARLAVRRLAHRPLGPPGHVALDRRALSGVRRRVRPGDRMFIRSSPRASSAAWASGFPRWPPRFTSRKLRRRNIADAWPACSSSTSSSASSSPLRPMPCSRGSAQMPGAGCWGWRRFRRCSTPLFCFGIPESPRWLLGRKGDRQKGVEVLRLIEPQASPAEIEAKADEIMASSSEHGFLRDVSGRGGCACPSCSPF